MTAAGVDAAALTGIDEEPTLIVAECFGVEQPTFQGEGPSSGVPALFIRLSRCNLTCEWCDTTYTWDWSRFDPRKESRRRTVADLLAWALRSDVELVVITGGEPLIQQKKLAPLARGLLAAGKRVEFETNGTIVPDPKLLLNGIRFNVSPKLANSGVAEAKRIVPDALEAFAATGRAAFKFVTRTVAELEEIGALADRYGLDPVWVMPEGATPEGLIETTRVLADAVAARRWRFAQRLHVLAFAETRTLTRPFLAHPIFPTTESETMTHAVYGPAPNASSAAREQADPATPGPVDAERVADLIRRLLAALGEDPEREGLAGTPARVAAWYHDFLSPDPSADPTCFTEKALSGQLVVVGGMSVWAFCEHHMLPMNMEVAIGYVPEGAVVGLSKFGRIARRYAGRLQVQERFTRQVAEEISRVIGSQDVAVAVRATHLCMSMRGVRMESARTTTLQAGGRFQDDPVLSQQFLTVTAGQWRAA